MDIFGIAVAETAHTDGMFEGTSSLKRVRVKDENKIVKSLPEGFEQMIAGGVYGLEDGYQFWITREDGSIVKPQEIIAAASDISKKGNMSQYFDEYQDYLVNGGDWDVDAGKPGPTFGRGLENGYGLMHIKWGDGREHTARIVGMNHDEKSDGSGKAGLTFQFTGLLYDVSRMNPSNDNTGGWRDSELRFRMNPAELGDASKLTEIANCNHDIWDAVPMQLKAAIIAVNKMSKNRDDGTMSNDSLAQIPVSITSDKLWIMSYPELVETCCIGTDGLEGEGNQYVYWNGKVTNNGGYNKCLIKYPNGSQLSYGNGWWLRSVWITNTTGFLDAGNTGYMSSGCNASYPISVCPCFCI